MYLIAVDAHSKWPEVVQMKTTTATQTIIVLRQMFCAYGIPEQLVSDNGPQFSSTEFAQFCSANGIKHIRVAPYHPSSNGLAERFVQTFKTAGLMEFKGAHSHARRICIPNACWSQWDASIENVRKNSLTMTSVRVRL